MRRQANTPLVDETKASHLTSLAKMISLCHSLEEAHGSERWAPSEPVFLSKANCSKKLREAIMFSTCGSYVANSIQIVEPEKVEDHRRTRKDKYVDKYIDSWTVNGTPTMWLSKKWRKPWQQEADQKKMQRSKSRSPFGSTV